MGAAWVFNFISDFRSEKEVATETHRIPEIHILLTKNIKDTTELGWDLLS